MNNSARKIEWFTPPFNMAIVNKIGRELFWLLKKNCPLSKGLFKIFNRNTIKLSYSWLVYWLVGFYGISNFLDYLTPNPFLCK